MIDRFLAAVGQRSHAIINDRATPIRAAKEQFYRVENSQHLTIVFGFWHASVRSLAQTTKHLNARGSDVLLFNLDPNVLHQRPAHVRMSFENQATEATAQANVLRNEYGYTSIDLLGFSLGNVPLCMTAERLHHFHAAELVVPGSDLALCLWYGIRTQRLRDAFLANGFTLESLQNEWKDLAPASHAKAFRGHEVTIYLARGDKFIPYRYGLELVAAFEKVDVHPNVKLSRIAGHALTITNYIRALG